MATENIATNDLIKRNYIKDGKGSIYMCMEGGTFTTSNGIKGSIRDIIPIGIEVTIDGDDSLSSYFIDTNKFVEYCVEDYKKRKGLVK